MNNKELLALVASIGVVGGGAAAIAYPLAESVGKKIAEYNPKDSELKENAKIIIGSLASMSIIVAASGGATGALWAITTKTSK